MLHVEIWRRQHGNAGSRKLRFAGTLLIFVGLAGALLLGACGSQPGEDKPVSSDQSQQQSGASGTGTEIVGVVTDEGGKPLAEVGISVTKGTSAVGEKLVLTDPDGKYTWGVPGGTYTLTAHLDGYQDESKEIQVKEGEQAKLDFQLKKLP